MHTTRARHACTFASAALLLGGCSIAPQTGGVPGMPSVVHIGNAARAASYETLYRFSGRRRPKHPWPGGAFPYAPLINVNGTMYGSTYAGGAGCLPSGCGTVYSISSGGVKNVIYRFGGGSADGARPTVGLLDVNGTLYGTTQHGGDTGCDYGYGCGTVFSISPSGSETVLHKFTALPDGQYPDSPLIDINGTLYGTTSGGGISGGYQYGCGTVYSITPSGSEKIVYAFKCGKDGRLPIGLLAVNQTMYGTTFDGGSGCSPQGCGTVYRMSTGGAKKTLHIFRSSEGEGPNAALINVNGTLYGTTGVGGVGCFPFGCGTVFSVSLKGALQVLYQFAGGTTDGSSPSGLTYMNGMFYGTTQYGGTGGTLYSVSATGQETVLHLFTGVPDGSGPQSVPLALNGALYGTTQHGGDDMGCRGGCGTIYALTP